MKYADKPCSNCMTEKKRMLFEIDKVSFVLTELVLYLDTHPTDTKTIEFFLYYKKKRHDLLIEYAEKSSVESFHPSFHPANIATPS